MTLDSGADHTVVRADLISGSDYMGRSSRVGNYCGWWREMTLANVWIKIGREYKFMHEVLVVPRDCPNEVLLGNDLEIFDDLYRLAQVNGNPDPNIKVVTRVKARKQKEQEELDKTRDA